MSEKQEFAIRLCKKCNSQMSIISGGRGRKRWSCQKCHLEDLKTKYKESRNAAIKRYQKTSKGKESKRRCAIKECGVPSMTSRYSKRSEKFATQARTLWCEADDALLSGPHTEGQLSKMLGRSIRAIQTRKRRLRDQNKSAAELVVTRGKI